MAIKSRTNNDLPPLLNERNETAPQISEQRILRVNPELDARLSKFMEQNGETVDYYRNLVKENPERAVRAIMLGRMLKHEDQQRIVQRQMPQVMAWVESQPGMREKIEERIRNVNPANREKAFVNEAMRIKSRIDFSPKPSIGASL